MKICWDNIQNMYLSKRGNLRLGGQIYIEVEKCSICKNPYLARKHSFEKGLDRFCSNDCYSYSKIGTHHTEKSKAKISEANKDRVPGMLGKKHKKETIRKMSLSRSGDKHHNYKGGIHTLCIPLFDTYAEKIDYAEQTRYTHENGFKVLQVTCSKCGEWHTPTTAAVWRRVYSLEGTKQGESRFYCSDSCKDACEVFNQKKYPKLHNVDLPFDYVELRVWRAEVLMRECYKCEYCGEVATDAHHERPKKLEPSLALDPDNGIACCKKCHYKYGHRDECSTGALASIVCGGGK